MKKYIIVLLLSSFSLGSCNKWLDVEPRGEARLDHMFTSYKGFTDVLTGCYIKLNARSLYGERLTMSGIEALGQMWELNQTSSQRYADRAFAIYDYENSYSRNAIAETYLALYNVIVQANTIIQNLERNGHVITDPKAFAIIKGEAYAIRALCHLDILRLFGQMPNHTSLPVSLPYAEEVSNKILPTYYDFESFVKKIEYDLLIAEEVMKAIDPVLTTGMMGTSDEDQLFNYRGHTLNYYAVKALQARLYLYVNKTDKAYAAAKVVYDAKPVSLSGMEDLPRGYLSSPSESLFALSNNKLMTYSRSIFGVEIPQVQDSHLFLTTSRLESMFEMNLTDNRYRYIWVPSSVSPSNQIRPISKKHWYNVNAGYTDPELLTKLDIIPMIRMSEIYLILMETAANNEANVYRQQYLQGARGIATTAELDDENMKVFVVNEIRREFFAEGHMFYTYKRLGQTQMKWGTLNMGENGYERYILPLPMSEYDPSK